MEAQRVRTGGPAGAGSGQALVQEYRPRRDLAPSPDAVAAAQGVLALPAADRARTALDAVTALTH